MFNCHKTYSKFMSTYDSHRKKKESKRVRERERESKREREWQKQREWQTYFHCHSTGNSNLNVLLRQNILKNHEYLCFRQTKERERG